tara:strand:- start:608 stop:769 length:162 start_codon:yes stop_codon:yes gene_type:complete
MVIIPPEELERVTGIEPVSSAWKAEVISRYTIPANFADIIQIFCMITLLINYL